MAHERKIGRILLRGGVKLWQVDPTTGDVVEVRRDPFATTRRITLDGTRPWCAAINATNARRKLGVPNP